MLQIIFCWLQAAVVVVEEAVVVEVIEVIVVVTGPAIIKNKVIVAVIGEVMITKMNGVMETVKTQVGLEEEEDAVVQEGDVAVEVAIVTWAIEMVEVVLRAEMAEIMASIIDTTNFVFWFK